MWKSPCDWGQVPITQTAVNPGVNLAHYLHDRPTGAYRMPSLAAVIAQHVTYADAALIVASHPSTFRLDTEILYNGCYA